MPNRVGRPSSTQGKNRSIIVRESNYLAFLSIVNMLSTSFNRFFSQNEALGVLLNCYNTSELEKSNKLLCDAECQYEDVDDNESIQSDDEIVLESPHMYKRPTSISSASMSSFDFDTSCSNGSIYVPSSDDDSFSNNSTDSDLQADAYYSSGYRRDLQEPLLLADDYASLMDPQYCDVVDEKRSIVDHSQLLKLFPSLCALCNAKVDVSVDTKFRGMVTKVNYRCQQYDKEYTTSDGTKRKCNFFGDWISSSNLVESDSDSPSRLNVALSLALFLSGNQFTKVCKFFNFLNINVLSAVSYHKYNKFLLDTLSYAYNKLQIRLFEKIGTDPVTVVGDCQNDSPGYSAHFGVYSWMHAVSGYILSACLVDRRETHLNSPRMEIYGFIRGLAGSGCGTLLGNLNTVCVCTDAHIQIGAFMDWCKSLDPRKRQKAVNLINEACECGHDVAEEKRIFLSQLVVQRDPWHLVKNVAKSLTKLASGKGMAIIGQHKTSIIEHLWYCMRTCNGSLADLEIKWYGMLYHLCGIHQWATGACEHGPLSANDRKKPLFNSDSRQFEALAAFVKSPKLIRQFVYYVHFIHSGELESYHSLRLTYASKRSGFSYIGMLMRMYVAILDHNYHLHRAILSSADGTPLVSRKYKRGSNHWVLINVKEPKDNKIMKYIMTRCCRHIVRNDLDAIALPNLPDNIAPVPAPSMRELFVQRRRRARLARATSPIPNVGKSLAAALVTEPTSSDNDTDTEDMIID